MTGISVGWFDPSAISPLVEPLVLGIEQLLARDADRRRHWPMGVKSIRADHRDVGVSYMLVNGSIPLHIDPVSEIASTKSFLFVLHTVNRPALVTSPVASHTTPIFGGFAPPTQVQTFALGAIELKVAQAVHFDTAAVWHGIVGMPMVDDNVGFDRMRAVIVKVDGFNADQVGDALDHAARWIGADMAVSARQ